MIRQLQVLGSQAAYPTTDQPCSGFLLTWDTWQIVLDLGYGTLKGLLEKVPDGRVSAIIITHDHPDHWLDLHGLFRLLYYGPRSTTKIPLYCTAGVIEKMHFLESDVDLEDVFEIHILEDGTWCTFGPFHLTGILLPHHVPNIGIRLSVESSGAVEPLLAYTGDTGPCPKLAELGKKVRVYIMDSTDRPGEEEKARYDRKLLQSEDAGEWAKAACAQSLLLTHYWPTNNRNMSFARAKDKFGGDVYIAEPGLVLALD